LANYYIVFNICFVFYDSNKKLKTINILKFSNFVEDFFYFGPGGYLGKI